MKTARISTLLFALLLSLSLRTALAQQAGPPSPSPSPEIQSESPEAKKRRELHWMKCPKCGSDLVQENIAGVKVEKCPLCEGIFLDRGEFEELILKKHEDRRSFMRRLTGLFSS